MFSGRSSGFFPLSNPASLLDHHSVCYFLFAKKISLCCYIFQDSQFEHFPPLLERIETLAQQRSLFVRVESLGCLSGHGCVC